jgi:hypothetical protein
MKPIDMATQDSVLIAKLPHPEACRGQAGDGLGGIRFTAREKQGFLRNPIRTATPGLREADTRSRHA